MPQPYQPTTTIIDFSRHPESVMLTKMHHKMWSADLSHEEARMLTQYLDEKTDWGDMSKEIPGHPPMIIIDLAPDDWTKIPVHLHHLQSRFKVNDGKSVNA